MRIAISGPYIAPLAVALAAVAGISHADEGSESAAYSSSWSGPLQVEVKSPLPPGAQTRATTREGIRLAIQADTQGRCWCWGAVRNEGSTIVAEPLCWPTDQPDAGVKIERNGERELEVSIDGRPFTTFHFAPDEPKPFLWPVIGPTGGPVTRAYPMKEVEGERHDHPHHRSIWAAWGDIRTGDMSKPGNDYWSQTKDPNKQARQIVKRIVRTLNGPVFGEIEAEIEWTAASGRREFTELRTYRFYRGGPNNRMIDVRNVFKFDDGDVMFADTKEAGILSVRVASSMDEKQPGQGHMVNSRGGRGANECWGMPAEWCDYVGPVDGQTIGIAVFDAEANPGHPPRWHIRDYGLYSVNPFGIKDFPGGKGKDGSHTFKQGESAEFNYRIVIHKEDTSAAHIADQYKLYLDPPTVKPNTP